ncbi:biotin-dependent carboxyltransferase family protein [Lysobacter sp. GX 14042]|uniref:5-oxoprolinase subunit C family protein n=1 Tax=Lysobacter sp. GX 14042 TaxID=2907155 RepID=UPI001F468150|nr:biotin-dependent carboxyltransferase family protein [Lysobacter sp. GX 14042]
MTLRVLDAGPLTTVQDLGRSGWRHLGVPLAGALDPRAAALANRLAGNPDAAALLEFTLAGPRLAFGRPVRVALTGGPADVRFRGRDGRRHALHAGRPVLLPPGELHVRALLSGARGWLAVAGGLDVPEVLGSRSTDLRGGFGGVDGRALREGDRLDLVHPPELQALQPVAPGWWIDPAAGEEPGAPLRFVPAAGTDPRQLARTRWTASPHSNRQGIRLAGKPLPEAGPQQPSAPVAPGTLQLPPDGLPIVLLADAQTVGGYRRLGYVIAADLPRLAQVRPGDALWLQPCDAAEAARRLAASRARWARIGLALEARR